MVGCNKLPDRSGTFRDAPSKDMMNSESEGGIRVNNPIVIPPGYDERPDINNPLDASNPDMAFSKNMKGLNLEMLFSEDIEDTDKRFERLEKAFIAFRREYEDIRPAIMRLTAIESDMQELVGDLETLTKSGDVAPIAEGEGTPVEAVAEPQALLKEDINTPNIISSGPEEGQAVEQISKKPVSDDTKIQDIRIGLHPDKERIVIELSGKNTYAIDLDNQEKLLIVHLKGLKESSTAISAHADLKSYVISSYNFSDSEEGMDILFQLKKSTKVLTTEWLDATTGFPSHRLVIDLEN